MKYFKVILVLSSFIIISKVNATEADSGSVDQIYSFTQSTEHGENVLFELNGHDYMLSSSASCISLKHTAETVGRVTAILLSAYQNAQKIKVEYNGTCYSKKVVTKVYFVGNWNQF